MGFERELELRSQPDYNSELSHLNIGHQLSYSERHEIDTFIRETGYIPDGETD